MFKYAMFLKEIVSNKKKLTKFDVFGLNENLSIVILNNLPPKLKDPTSFTIPCTIDNSYFKNILCDLRASINLIPLSIFKRLGMFELQII
uniref:Uncharacterized protein n=1 Tax=Cajanus cajan TaxID=3821 RepID=A0A151REU4_CAJCA|nr:hypothetical protein KK1_037657 [Cajanus cajan]